MNERGGLQCEFVRGGGGGVRFFQRDGILLIFS